MAKSFKDWFNLLHEGGEDTVNETVIPPESGKTEWTFGRSTDCDFVYSVPGVSRAHCKIKLIDAKFYIADMGSTNGTYLNGKPVERMERIFAGDVVSMGSTDFVFSPEYLD